MRLPNCGLSASPASGHDVTSRSELDNAEARNWVRPLLAIVLGMTSLGCRDDSPPAYVRLSGPAPVLTETSNTPAILVVFWASWCAPCREETPQLLALAEEPPASLSVVVFSHDDDASVRTFFRGEPPAVLHLRQDADKAIAASFGVSTLPASFLIVHGQRVARFSGPRDWNSAAMRHLLRRLIDEGVERLPTASGGRSAANVSAGEIAALVLDENEVTPPRGVCALPPRHQMIARCS